jgi:endonuclease/exonuclease/phosphatase family metal-dependent hydrolase
MKLITWNIQWALGTDGIMSPARIVSHAKAMADFDVLCLQEVADNWPELKASPVTNQFADFAALLPGYQAIDGVALETRDTSGRPKRFGNMILTRLPVVQVLRHILPWPAVETNNMPRGLIETVVMATSGPLRLMTTHLEYSHPAIRREQVEALRDIHASACARVATPRSDGAGTYARTPSTMSAILTGDFNMKPDDPLKQHISDPFDQGWPRLVDSWTVLNGDRPHPLTSCIIDQTHGTPHCCDYVFITEDLAPRIRRIACDGETRVSDHQPILIEIEA